MLVVVAVTVVAAIVPREWAIRCYHEASQHDQNCFITLTYEDAPDALL